MYVSTGTTRHWMYASGTFTQTFIWLKARNTRIELWLSCKNSMAKHLFLFCCQYKCWIKEALTHTQDKICTCCIATVHGALSSWTPLSFVSETSSYKQIFSCTDTRHKPPLVRDHLSGPILLNLLALHVHRLAFQRSSHAVTWYTGHTSNGPQKERGGRKKKKLEQPTKPAQEFSPVSLHRNPAYCTKPTRHVCTHPT